jgi:hypothetical protein
MQRILLLPIAACLGIALSGCEATTGAVDAARQTQIDAFCRNPRTTRGSAEAVAGCIAGYRSAPADLRLPDPADVPLAGEPGYDPEAPTTEAWVRCPSCA